MSQPPSDVLFTFRTHVTPEDPENVRRICLSSGFFYPDEIDTAVSLVEERLRHGEASGYFFVFAESGGETVGYTCFGHIACTGASYDLYWIAVHEEYRGKRLGKLLLAESERDIAARGGRRVYIETSDRPQYEPTRGFYLRCGYEQEAVLKDFYHPNDSKVIYVKALS
jgi:D-alanine-D-alanine ligase